MPASHKMIKARQQAANRAAGVGVEQGRIPMRVKTTEVNAACTLCQQAIRMTKKNIEAVAHWEAKHPTVTFATCFPGQYDPTQEGVAAASASSSSSAGAGAGAGSGAADASAAEGATETAAAPVAKAPAPAPKKKPAQDLSFLDAALDVKGAGKKK
jgi:hypothetical protein